MSTTLLSRPRKEDLLQEIGNHPKVPSPPTVVLQVLDRASNPDCTINELCGIIQVDPGLAGRILRIVNSATFGLSRPVASIQRALAVVGVKSARLLALSISLPEMQRQAGNIDGAWAQHYWKRSVAGAIVARALSRRASAPAAEDDMTAALLRDLGELIFWQRFPDAYQSFLAEASTCVTEQCALEETRFGLNHAEVSAHVLERWGLPLEIGEAVRHHHHPESGRFTSPAARARAYLLHFATRAAELLEHPDDSRVLTQLTAIAGRHFQMSQEQLREFLIPLSREITDFAALLRVDIGGADYQAVLTRAGEELVNLTVATNLEQQRAAQETRRAESEARRWKEEAVLDPLTKVFNRRFLETKLHELFGKPAPARRFGLAFLDLDGFKPLNDRFGHAFGDVVLKSVADCLGRQVRDSDIVARFGGDEFCVLCTSIDTAGLEALCQRIWQSINDMTITLGPNQGKVGISIGAVPVSAESPWDRPEALLAAADELMYQAKSQGKNCVRFWQTCESSD
jgi:diguanylate cyclase (GGDEF)-like protein